MIAKPKEFNLVLYCREDPQNAEIVRVDHIQSNFLCPVCKKTVLYIASEKKLGIHGRSDKTLKHELRQITEL